MAPVPPSQWFLLHLLLLVSVLPHRGESAAISQRFAPLLLSLPPSHAPERRLMSLALCHLTSAALHVFVDLDLAHRLRIDEPRTLDQVLEDADGATTRWNADAMLRVLRLLDASAGVVKETDADDTAPTFVLTPLGAVLQQEGPANMIRHWMETPLWNAWAQLPQLCRGDIDNMVCFTSEPSKMVTSWHDWYSSASESSVQAASGFQEWIADLEEQACLDGFPWALFHGRTVLELGGHHGTFLTKLADRHPEMHLLCLDLPQVVEGMPSGGDGDGHAVTFIAGDLLDPSTWPSCDAIFMKHIIFCDWNEHTSLRILQQCATHLQQTDGRFVLIAEACVDTTATAHNDVAAAADVFLLLDPSRQRSRTRREWEEAADSCGFRLVTVTSTASPTCSLLVLERTQR